MAGRMLLCAEWNTKRALILLKILLTTSGLCLLSLTGRKRPLPLTAQWFVRMATVRQAEKTSTHIQRPTTVRLCSPTGTARL